MRHTLTHFSVTDNVPHCDHCGAPLKFANAADQDRSGRVYLIFKCVSCAAGESKVWRPEWQAALADSLVADDE
jgi:hypothetical protein